MTKYLGTFKITARDEDGNVFKAESFEILDALLTAAKDEGRKEAEFDAQIASLLQAVNG